MTCSFFYAGEVNSKTKGLLIEPLRRRNLIAAFNQKYKYSTCNFVQYILFYFAFLNSLIGIKLDDDNLL